MCLSVVACVWKHTVLQMLLEQILIWMVLRKSFDDLEDHVTELEDRIDNMDKDSSEETRDDS